MSTYIIDFKSHKTKCKTSLNTTSNWSSKIWRFTTWSIWRFCITLWYNFMYTSLYKTNYLTDFHWKRIWSAPAQYTSKWPAHYQDLFSFKRVVPGEGVRHPKYLLLKFRISIATRFKQQNPNFEYSFRNMLSHLHHVILKETLTLCMRMLED